MPINVVTWKILRKILRVQNEKTGRQCSGREIRSELMSRASKDGTFLDRLIDIGFVSVFAGVTADPLPGPAADVEPVQFRRYYRLTPFGELAAEYGEVEIDPAVYRAALKRTPGAPAVVPAVTTPAPPLPQVQTKPEKVPPPRPGPALRGGTGR